MINLQHPYRFLFYARVWAALLTQIISPGEPKVWTIKFFSGHHFCALNFFSNWNYQQEIRELSIDRCNNNHYELFPIKIFGIFSCLFEFARRLSQMKYLRWWFWLNYLTYFDNSGLMFPTVFIKKLNPFRFMGWKIIYVWCPQTIEAQHKWEKIKLKTWRA